MNWQEELDFVLDENNRDGEFGTNIDWDVKDVRKYIKKLENMGCYDFHFPSYYTTTFGLPLDSQELLLFIITSERRFSGASYNKKKHKLTLEWDY